MISLCDQYRLAWRSYLLSQSFADMHMLEEFMDELQEQIAPGGHPGDDRWLKFVDTLPEFVNYWQNPEYNRF